jgi:hypothetical protein
MGRFQQPKGEKGSLRWVQYLVNQQPAILDEAIGLGRVDWRSPRAEDDYAEYHP